MLNDCDTEIKKKTEHIDENGKYKPSIISLFYDYNVLQCEFTDYYLFANIVLV